ncbi:hypothetical protein ACFWIA_27915 [Streptomyces sp. NPDC127068]
MFHEGRVAQRGTPTDLLALDGHYARFWHQRSRAAGWRITTARS